jgi:hypothetical protein
MNLFDLIFLAIFAGGGALIGARIWSIPGAVLGAILGVAVRFALGSLLDRESRRLPNCACGARSVDYATEHDESHGIVNRCRACSRVYTMRAGKAWYEILGDGRSCRRMRRTFLGGWRPTSDETARPEVPADGQASQPTG